MRGPGIIPGSTFPQLATNVDLGPTIMSLAGIDAGEIAAASDGQSMLPLMISPTWRDEGLSLPASVRAYLVGLDQMAAAAGNSTITANPPTARVDGADAGTGRAVEVAGGGAGKGQDMVKATWRQSIFHEYYYIGIGLFCGMDTPIEDESSNFIAVRHMSDMYGNILYAEFQNGTGGQVDFQTPNYYEMFDMDKDEWQTTNIYANASASAKDGLHKEVQSWLKCRGGDCP